MRSSRTSRGPSRIFLRTSCRNATAYPGDLLCKVLELPHGLWAENPELRTRVAAVAARAIELTTGEHDQGPVVEKAIRRAYDVFLTGAQRDF